MYDRNRRKFLSLGVKTLCGAGLAMGASPWHTLTNVARADSTADDYRALVCIYLEGGMDGFSLLVPDADAEYAEYNQSRRDLSVARSGLINLPMRNANTVSAGLHPQCAALSNLYNENRLAFVANVGTLIEPTTREQFESKSVRLPSQLFSHSDQEIQWQQLQGQTTTTEGWGALAARELAGAQERDYLTSVSLSGANYWQASSEQRPYSVRSSGLVQYAGMSDGSEWQQPRVESFREISNQKYSHAFMQAYADLQRRAGDITTELGAVLADQPDPATPMPMENQLAEKLRMVARMIAVHQVLGMRRQIFYVSMDGWDVHDKQNKDQPYLFQQLTDAMAYFQSSIDELGIDEQVTTFTASDFGRSLTSNGDGTDHGWGNHHIVMGSAVEGGDIYGQMPRMSTDGPDAVRNGRVVPTLSASQYAATMLRWIGLNDGSLNNVLPDLGNFAQHNLGFLRT